MTASLPRPVADLSLSLDQQVFASDTTAHIVVNEDSQGNALPGGLYGLTISLSDTDKEYIVGTLSGTTLTSIVSIDEQGNATTGFSQYHRAGATVTITDWVTLKRMFDLLTAVTGFDSGAHIGYDNAPVGLTGNQFATVNYVLSVVSGGTVTFDQQVLSNQILGETVATRAVVYFKEADQRWYNADQATSATYVQTKLGICLTGGIVGATTSIAISGPVTGYSGLTAGSKYYVGTTGAITLTAGAQAIFLGWALSTTSLLLSVNSINIPTAAEKAAIGSLAAITGSIVPYAGRVTPTGYLPADGSAVSRATYATLLSVLAPSGVVTITIASPAVLTKTSHGYVAGDKVSFTSTGVLPTGIAASIEYFVISTGLTTNTFEVALSPEGTAVNTSGGQSGVHTVYATNWGFGDGATTFNVPDLRNKTLLGIGSGGTETLKFEAGAVNTGTDAVAVPSYFMFPSQGQAVQITTTGGLPAGLSLATTYYVIRVDSTHIKFATTPANAGAGTAIDLTTTGSGVSTIVYTNVTGTVLGEVGGEEFHDISVGELAAHTHSTIVGGTGGNSTISSASGTGGAQPNPLAGISGLTGSNTPHNSMMPFARVLWIIKT